MKKVRKSFIRRRNSSAEDHEEYRRKSQETEPEPEEQVRPRCNSKHSYLSRIRSKSDDEVFDGSLDRRFVVEIAMLLFVELN